MAVRNPTPEEVRNMVLQVLSNLAQDIASGRKIVTFSHNIELPGRLMAPWAAQGEMPSNEIREIRIEMEPRFKDVIEMRIDLLERSTPEEGDTTP
jgi:hypothetical protein